MLFIHGGNFQYQGANSPLFDGQFMSNSSDTLVVIIQYRLGKLKKKKFKIQRKDF
jgi:carboxylesterase type B